VVKTSAPATKAAIVPAKVAVATAPASKAVAQGSKPEPKQQAKAAPAKAAPAKSAPVAKIAAPAVSAPTEVPAKSANAPKQPKSEEKKWAMNGKRDPFFSPVVQTNGSGCSTGKKCLEIGGINLRGVVKSDAGFIAVVTNNLNKAYFLRENDPVFNGYVVKITGDSVVFQETIQDKLGKPFTREVVKRIFTPAV
jgi:Tfp pilus assembly protein PilP